MIERFDLIFSLLSFKVFFGSIMSITKSIPLLHRDACFLTLLQTEQTQIRLPDQGLLC